MVENKGIPYGPTYPPLSFKESDWDRDLELMARANMDVVRVGDIGAWERIEVESGRIDLEKLARFYSLADRYGIQVLLGTGTSSPPLWLALEYPDVRIKSSRDELYPLGASYHWACVHHPGYLAACERYITALVKFAVQQPNHFGWQIGNEIGFPFNPTRENNDIDLYCYCEHSQEGFRHWLQEKYGEIERVTKAWSWSTTNFVYHRWEDLFPPEALPVTWSSVTRWLDWRLFWQQAIVDHVAWQHSLIKKYDPDHPTSLNTFNFKGYDRFGTYTGLDQWKISLVVDHLGYDLYPGSGNKLESRPEHTSIFLDHGRSVSSFAGSDFWIPEIESGPIGGWLLGPERRTDDKDILNMCLESLGHDAKLIIYMPWREWLFQPLHWGAVVDLQGSPTPRYEAAAAIGRYIRENATFLENARVPKGEVALLESKANAIFLRGVGQEDQLFEAQRGAYRAFWERGYRVDFISETQLLEGKADDYPLICLPLFGLITLEMASALKAYVSQGGILLGFARCGTLDEKGWYHPSLPVKDLADVFGLERIEADHLSNQKISLDHKTYQSWMNRDILYPRRETRVLGTFEDGLPAITMASCGSGLGIYIATQADAGYLKPGAGVIADVIEMVSRETGLAPSLSIKHSHQLGREIDPHLLETPERTEIIIANYAANPEQVEIRLREKERTAARAELGLDNKTPLPFKQSHAEILLSFKLAKKEVQTISIYWK